MRINSTAAIAARSTTVVLTAVALVVATACAPAAETANAPGDAEQTGPAEPNESATSPCVPPEIPKERPTLRSRASLMGSYIVAPVQISTVLPEYTPEATTAGIEGDVYIEAVITTDGNVVEPVLVRGLPDDELNCRALVAITKWEFKSATSSGEPVDVIALFTVAFRLQPGRHP